MRFWNGFVEEREPVHGGLVSERKGVQNHSDTSSDASPCEMLQRDNISSPAAESTQHHKPNRGTTILKNISPHFQHFLSRFYSLAPFHIILAVLICIIVTIKPPPLPPSSVFTFPNITCALIISLVFHELGHMLAGIGENCRVMYVGVAFVRGSPAAFVDVNQKDLEKSRGEDNSASSWFRNGAAQHTVNNHHHMRQYAASRPGTSPRNISPALNGAHRFSLREHFRRIKIFSAGVAHNLLYCIFIYIFLSKSLWVDVLWEKRPQVRIWHIDPSSPLHEHFGNRDLKQNPLILEKISGHHVHFVEDVDNYIKRMMQDKFCISPVEYHKLEKNGAMCCTSASSWAATVDSSLLPQLVEEPKPAALGAETNRGELICIQRYQPFFPAERIVSNSMCISARDLVQRRRCLFDSCPNFEYCTETTSKNIVQFTIGFENEPEYLLVSANVEEFYSQVYMTHYYSKIPGLSIETLADFRDFLQLTVFLSAFIGVSNVVPLPQLDGDKVYIELALLMKSHFGWTNALRVYKWLRKAVLLVGLLALTRIVLYWLNAYKAHV